MRYELTIKIGSNKEQKFVGDSIKNVVVMASEELTCAYGNQAFLNDSIKKWKKNQFFFRSAIMSSELTKI